MTEEWYGKRRNIVRGPFSPEEIRRIIESKKLQREDYVKLGIHGEWISVGVQFAFLFPQDNTPTTVNESPTIPSQSSPLAESPTSSSSSEHLHSQSATEPHISMQKYPAITVIMVLHIVFAFIISTSLFFIAISNLSAENPMPGVPISVVAFLIGGVISLAMFAVAQALQIFMDIESNLREIRDRLPVR